MIIAIDGPAGSGKSSTARAVAKELGFRHLDSGAFYRAITYAAMQRGIPAAEWPQLDAARLESFDVTAEPVDTGFRMLLAGNDISGPIRRAEVNALVSAMARLPAVREWLLGTLRHTARTSDLVADGRDIGTVVFPDADLKIFLVADPVVRAKRRLQQMGLPTDEAGIAEEVSRIEERDRADSERDIAPLRQAKDAVLLDTTLLRFEEQVERIVLLARERQQT
ncbi:MAG TPA: (d)CMP kinase [Longimicrobiales bacterium]|nr:(d)CMP kinase [Longimicrobiales bacterium]